MKTKIIFFSIFGCFLISHSFAQNIPIDSIEIQIDRIMKDFDIPGLSIGVVRNDSIVLAKGYGHLEINKKRSVDENTIFGIGSISKSFTALTLGILVDEGKIDWDDKVRDYLPYFELYDPYVSDHFTIKDLLIHRSGLKDVSGGTLWYHSDYSRTEVIKRLKYLDPVSGFREKPAYQNVMFVVASEIVKEVSGMSWDHFLRSRVFDKLKMTQTTSLSAEREANANLAQPHIRNDVHQKVAIKQEKGDNLAPGGFIYSSAKDMSNYMKMLLNNGTFEKDTIVSSKIINEIFKPQVIFPIGGPPFYNEFTSYGFGWWLTPKNGHKIIAHSGGIDGMSANLIMIKDMNIGFVILTNESQEPATFLLTARILELLLHDKSYDIYSRVKESRDLKLKNKKDAPVEISKYPNTKPSLKLEQFAGKYTDKMYGDITINYTKNKKLEIAFSHSPVFKGKLEHWHFDTFKIDWDDIRVPNGFLTFNFNSKREIIGFSLDQKNLLDVDFGELNILRNTN